MKHGGRRKGSGAKKRYGEKTLVLSFRVPISKANIITKLVNKKLSSYAITSL